MKKLLKTISVLLVTVVLSVFGLTACGGSDKPGGGIGSTEVGEKTITIKCVRAGFGTDWLYELKAKFENAFKDEGYTLNILTPDRSMSGDNVVRDLYLGYDEAKVDLYITGDVTTDMVSSLGEYGLLVHDLEELVYNQKPISYDGSEENVTVMEKLSSDVYPYIVDATGLTTGFNWVQSSAGLVVNTRKLANYGITEMPRTTNEMFECFDAIYLGANGLGNSYQTGTFPITYIPGTASGYVLCFLNTLMAQYDREFYDQFWTFETTDAEGNVARLEDSAAQNLFKHDAVYEMLNVAYRALDVRISAPGSTNQSLDQAQAKVMSNTNSAVFMFNGDWMLNEVKLNYKNYLHDIDFINFPVVSALGTKLFGAGSAYNKSDAECDELLSFIISLVDENKTIDEIDSAVQAEFGYAIAKTDIREVARARGVSYARGVEHMAFIAKDSPKKEISALLLRMMASDDFGKTFSQKANGATPYYAEVITDTEYSFVTNSSKIPANSYYSLISGKASGYRRQLGILHQFTTTQHIPNEIVTKSTATMFENGALISGVTAQVYADAARALLNSEYNNVVSKWFDYKTAAGI